MLINLSNHPLAEWDEKQKRSCFSIWRSDRYSISCSTSQADPFEIDRMTDEYLQKYRPLQK